MADKPGIPNYLPIFINTLEKRGVSTAGIEAFRKHWEALPSHAPDLPCPLCHAAGAVGKLIALPQKDGQESVRCKECGTEIVVNQDV